MAHFVDGIRLRRISDQPVHVPLRRTTLVGLWRGFEPGGIPLAVSVAAGGPLLLRERATRGDFRIFALQGVRVADVQLVALDSRGRVVDKVDVHVHMPRTRQLPPFDKLLSHYAGDDESSEDFRQRIGGQVDNPQLANTCTLRISEAFNYAGQPIPHRRAGLLTVQGADDKSYAFRVAEFRQYLLATYGQPDIVRTPIRPARTGVSPADFGALRGVMCFEVHFGDATGHFTLWDGTQAIHGDYFDQAFRVSLWMAG